MEEIIIIFFLQRNNLRLFALTSGRPQSHSSPFSTNPFPHTALPYNWSGAFWRQKSKPWWNESASCSLEHDDQSVGLRPLKIEIIVTCEWYSNGPLIGSKVPYIGHKNTLCSGPPAPRLVQKCPFFSMFFMQHLKTLVLKKFWKSPPPQSRYRGGS